MNFLSLFEFGHLGHSAIWDFGHLGLHHQANHENASQLNSGKFVRLINVYQNYNSDVFTIIVIWCINHVSSLYGYPIRPGFYSEPATPAPSRLVMEELKITYDIKYSEAAI